MPSVHLTQGDVGDAIHVICRNADGTAIGSLSGATVTFRMRRLSDGHTVTGGATVTGANNDELLYTTQAGDTAHPGVYEARFVVTLGGAVRSFPSGQIVDGLQVVVMAGP